MQAAGAPLEPAQAAAAASRCPFIAALSRRRLDSSSLSSTCHACPEAAFMLQHAARAEPFNKRCAAGACSCCGSVQPLLYIAMSNQEL